MTAQDEQLRGRTLVLALAALLMAAAATPLLARGYFHLGFGSHYGHPGYHGHYRHYGPYRPYAYSYHPYRAYHYRPYYAPYRYGPYGALDLNVKPKDAEVFVDGEYVGQVRQFDGWPSYLWLEKDRHEVIIYREGYETLVRHFEVRPGAVIKVKDRLRPGEARRPETLTAARSEPSPPRYGREAPRRATPPPAERAERDRATERAPRSNAPVDARREPGRIRLTIAPADASVYLDGRFLGTGRDFDERRPELLLDPGEHRLEVVRPGYRAAVETFALAPDEALDLAIELEPIG